MEQELTDDRATVSDESESVDAVAMALTDFVYVEGRDFKLNNRRFRHVGVNIPHLLYETRDQQELELAGAARAKIKNIRIFLPNDQYEGREIGDRLQTLLDMTYSLGIRLTVAVTHAYLVKVGTPEHRFGYVAVKGDAPTHYTRAIKVDGNDIMMLNDSWVVDKHLDSYVHLLWYIASRFKNHPGIFAWDVSNEVNVSNAGDEWLRNEELQFYTTMSTKLKEADPNHLVTTGCISTHWLGLTTDDLKRRLYSHPAIDYVVVHEYNDDSGNASHHTWDDIARANHSAYFNKPVVIEEFGASLTKYGDDIMGHVRRLYQRRFFGEPAGQVDSISQWSVTFHDTDTGNNDRIWGPKAQGLLEDYIAVWRDYSQRLESDNQFPNAVVVDNYYVHNDQTRAKVQASANWTPSRYVKQFWGTGYQFANSQVGLDDPFVFSFYLPAPATRIVDAWWTEGPTRSTQAPWRIETEQGVRLGGGTMNQRTLGGRWNKLGTTWNFPAGWNRIVFSRNASVSGEPIIADAVRIR